MVEMIPRATTVLGEGNYAEKQDVGSWGKSSI